MIQKLILSKSHEGSCYLVNPKDYDYDSEKVKEAMESFKELVLTKDKPRLLNGDGEKNISAIERIIFEFREPQTSNVRRFSLAGYIQYLSKRLLEIYNLYPEPNVEGKDEKGR